VPDDVEFQTKPQIAVGLIDRALGNGVRVAAWTFDELYGRDGKFLDGLEQRGQTFVAEVPVDFHGWVQKPKILRKGPKNSKKRGRRKQYPRLARRRPSCEVRNLVKYSPVFREQSWQRYHIKDTDKGPEVWEIKWSVLWRKLASPQVPYENESRPTRSPSDQRQPDQIVRRVGTSIATYTL